MGQTIGQDNEQSNRWRTRIACRNVSQLLRASILPIFVVTEVNGKHFPELFTGFLAVNWDRLSWLTAGHVIDQLQEMARSADIRIVSAKLLDNWESAGPDGASIPIDLTDLMSRSYSLSKTGIDFGLLSFRKNHAQLLLANPHVRYLTSENWQPHDQANLLGYYIVGYPEAWVDAEQSAHAGRVSGSVSARLAVLPVGRVEYAGPDEFDEFWADPGAIYGEVLPYSDDPGGQPDSVNWMSGGPMFAVSREPDGMHITLVGIQRSEKAKKRLIRTEPFDRILGHMNSAINSATRTADPE